MHCHRCSPKLMYFSFSLLSFNLLLLFLLLIQYDSSVQLQAHSRQKNLLKPMSWQNFRHSLPVKPPHLLQVPSEVFTITLLGRLETSGSWVDPPVTARGSGTSFASTFRIGKELMKSSKVLMKHFVAYKWFTWVRTTKLMAMAHSRRGVLPEDMLFGSWTKRLVNVKAIS